MENTKGELISSAELHAVSQAKAWIASAPTWEAKSFLEGEAFNLWVDKVKGMVFQFDDDGELEDSVSEEVYTAFEKTFVETILTAKREEEISSRREAKNLASWQWTLSLPAE